MLTTALLLATLAVEPIRLMPGGQEVVKLPGMTRVAISGDVADVKVITAGELMVIGKQRGRTTLTWWAGNKMNTRPIVVDDGHGSDLAKMVHDLISPSLTVEQFQDKVVIDGVLDSVDDFNRLKALVGNDPTVTVMAHLNPRVLPVVAEMITQALHREGLKTAFATCVGDRILLEGSVSDTQESQKAQMIADSVYTRATSGH
jgi:Flp pilus assembly secretin CpaC